MPEGKSDDLMEAAIRAVDAAREDLLLAKASDNIYLLRKVAISVVHGALLAERQGFAKIAEGKSEYPDDIWAEAKKVASVVLSGTRLDDASHASIDKAERLLLLSADVIAKALLAEREACAEIARTISTDLRNGGQTRFAAALIANSIRSGDRTSSTEES